VASASKLLCGSDPSGQTAPPRRLNRPGWPHLLIESSASVLWLNQVTQWFSGEPLQTPRTRCILRQSPLMTRLPRSPGDLGFEAQPRNRPRLRPAILATMKPALDSIGHQVPRTKPTCLLHTWMPHQRRPFALVLHLHQHQSSHNLHLQYLAKSQSTQHCQSLITPGSDHPPVLEPHMVLNLPLDECIDNTQDLVTREKRKRKEKKRLKETPTSDRKPKERQRARSLEEEQVSDPLGKGNGSTHLRQNHAQAKSTHHQSKARTTQRASPAHVQAPHEPKHTPPEPMQRCNMGMQQGAKTCSLCPGRLDRLPWAVRPPLCDLTT
jgi:hypothetical protein